MTLFARLRRWLEGPPEADHCIAQQIVCPRYSCRLTGEDFSRYDPGLQERARLRLEATTTMRAKAFRVDTGEAPPIREARRA